MYDFIDVNRYLEISDAYIKEPSDLIKLESIKNKSIVFCHDASVAESVLFPALKKVKEEIVLITVRDIEVSEQKTDKMPNNIIAWFGNNVTSFNKRVFGVPIGLPPINVSFNKFDGYSGIDKRRILLETIYNKFKDSDNIAYMSHSNHTNRRRSEVFNFFSNKSWVRSEGGRARINYKTYIENVKKHKYTISPVGAGIDCHRTWESLYLGRTPIVEKSRAMSFFDCLPILFVDRFENLKEDNLTNLQPKSKTLDALNFKYWEEKIKEQANAN